MGGAGKAGGLPTRRALLHRSAVRAVRSQDWSEWREAVQPAGGDCLRGRREVRPGGGGLKNSRCGLCHYFNLLWTMVKLVLE